MANLAIIEDKGFFVKHRIEIGQIGIANGADWGVARDMFNKDLKEGTETYGKYSEELRAEYAALDPHEVEVGLKEFTELYSSDFKEGYVWNLNDFLGETASENE